MIRTLQNLLYLYSLASSKRHGRNVEDSEETVNPQWNFDNFQFHDQ